MKRTPQLDAALQRLRSTPEFQVYVGALEDYLAGMTERLFNADSSQLAVAQGMCRALKTVLDVSKE